MFKYVSSLFHKKSPPSNVVNWAYDHQRIRQLEGLALTNFAPEPALTYYYHDVKSWFIKCPAFLSSLQNVYIIRSPIDMEVSYNRIDPNNKKMMVFKPSHSLVRDRILEPRFKEIEGSNAYEVFSLKMIPYVFWSDSSIMMDVIHPFLEWENPNKVRVIGGEFNIGKWIRGIEYAIEVLEPVGILRLRRGDPLLYVRFRADNSHTKIHLRESIITEEIKEQMKQNALLKTVMRGCPIEAVYELRRKFNERKIKAQPTS